MREITVKELVKVFEEKLIEVRQENEYESSITFEMSKARMEYDEEMDELCFTAGNYNTDGIGSVHISDIAGSVESIVEDDGEYILSFTNNISDIVISAFKTLEELEEDC